MPFPTPVVEIAFTDGPYVESPTWTDVTSYVREVTVNRGRTDDFAQFDTGTAQLVLDNRTRVFDPFYTAGAYYTKLTPRRQIRIRATATTTQAIFRGFVAGWPVTWSEGGYDSTVTIQCFDALGLMATEIIPTDWTDYYLTSLETYIAAGSATRYWKANDSRGTGTIRDQYAGVLSLTANTSTPNFFEQPALAPGLVGSSAACVDYRGSRTVSADPSQKWFMTLWMQPINQTAAYVDVLYEFGTANCQIQYNGTNNQVTIDLRWDVNSEGRRRTFTPTQNLALVPTHFTISGTPGNLTVYINGVEETTANTSPLQVASANEQAYAKGCTIQEWFVSTGIEPGASGTPTIATIAAALYGYGIGRVSETSSARMTRLIGTTSFPAGLQSFTASPAATVAEIGTGTGVIPEMQLVADSEGGELYVSKTGTLTTTNRTANFTAARSTTSQATFTDTGGAHKYGPEITLEYDGDNITNDVTVAFSGDGEVYASNTYATTTYGGAAITIETQLDSPTSADALALVELGVRGSLVPRLSPLEVGVTGTTAEWETLLGLELLDRVTFVRTPATGTAFSRDGLISSISHQMTPGVHRMQVGLSMRYTSPLTCDDDILGTVDFNYCG